jgi:hypothetical protein
MGWDVICPSSSLPPLAPLSPLISLPLFSCEVGTTSSTRRNFDVSCLADGEWSPMPPPNMCENVLCNKISPDSIPNGSVECSGFRFSDECKYVFMIQKKFFLFFFFSMFDDGF